MHHQFNIQLEGGIIGPLVAIVVPGMLGRLSDVQNRLDILLAGQKKVEEQLQMNEEKYRQFFETEPDGLALIDSETARIMEVNSAVTELMGYSREELINANALKLTIEPEKAIANIREQQDYVPVRYLKKKDGTIFPTEIRARHFELHDQRVFLLVIRDISERLEASRWRRLVDKQHQRSQRLEAIGTLSGGIAHDFNNILSAILGYTDLLRMQESRWNEKSLASLAQIQHAVRRATDLVKQILTFSRQTEVIKQPVLIIPIVKEALKLLRASIPARIEIRQHYDAERHTVIADPTQIHAAARPRRSCRLRALHHG